MHDRSTIWNEVSRWPPEQRRELAADILQSLDREEGLGTTSPQQRQALQLLIGIWKSDRPPSDEPVESPLDQERMKKYG